MHLLVEVTSVVTSEQINKEILKKGEVLIGGEVVNAQHIANQIAFKEAIIKYNIRRIFTFHKSVNTAKSFSEKGSKGIHTQLPELRAYNVNGTMTTAVREGIMHEFKNTDFSVISNARCLTEGVDLPAVDMVAFMSPKKSKVDIIQATGRAMRKDPQNPDKTLGYILVPLYLEITTDERVEDAVEKADFSEVWNVLQALQEHDEVLADVITQLQVDKGRGKIQEGNAFGDIIDILGVNISLKTLQKSITAVCVDKLAFTWDLRYGELIKYKEEYGDCNVPRKWTLNEQLGNWVGTQRASYHSKKLNDCRIRRLENIGFIWDLNMSHWEKMLHLLKKYKGIHNDCNVPSDWIEGVQPLGQWINDQREDYRLKKLNEEQVRRLEDMGFSWNPIWGKMLDTLIEYAKVHGDYNVPHNWIENKIPLGQWVRAQRRNLRSQKLSDNQIKRLNEIGF